MNWTPSPNFETDRFGATPDIVVLHYTAMVSARAAQDWLCDPVAKVSAHYLIDPTGAVVQMVDEAHRAWHAGAGCWGRVSDVNSHSIGIELANPGNEPFTAPLMDSLELLLAGIIKRRSIRPERVIGHSCMAPGRKIDPGPRFDWQRLARRGLAVWPNASGGSSAPCGPSSPEEGPQGTDEARFATLARRAGFTAPVDPLTLLSAVRLRFRPWGAGPLCGADLAAIADIAAHFPVDGAQATA